MLTFNNYLQRVNSKFLNNRHNGCEVVEAVAKYNLDEATSQL